MNSEDVPLRVLFVSSEVAPYSKTGGLGDVSGSLPGYLTELGAEVMVVSPYYLKLGAQPTWSQVRVGARDHLAILRQPLAPTRAARGSRGAGPQVMFVENDHFFGRESLYGHADDAERFIFFSRATLNLVKKLGWQPQVVHCNDWQTGLIPVLLRTEFSQDPFFARCVTVFTIHNLAYQGLFPAETMSLAGLDATLFTFDRLEFYGQFSFLKGGIVFSDLVTTVSPRYAEEIQSPEFGERLDGALRQRKETLIGILNGIDYQTWDPSSDRNLKRRYDRARVIAGKKANKKALRQEAGLPATNCPLIGVVSRLSDQKGFDILAQAAEELLALDLQLVVLGTGDAKYETMLVQLQKEFPGKVAAFIRFDERLAHRIYAGSDLFLMPSRYEPCGLGQMIALRYGSVPVVRATGGLADSVRDFTSYPNEGNGFVFDEYSAKALTETVRRTIQAFRDEEAWNRLVQKGMACDFSWNRSAREYLSLYETAIETRTGGAKAT